MLSLIADPNRLGGLPQTLQSLDQAAWSVRDRLSADTWRVINDIELRLRALTKDAPAELAGAMPFTADELAQAAAELEVVAAGGGVVDAIAVPPGGMRQPVGHTESTCTYAGPGVSMAFLALLKRSMG